MNETALLEDTQVACRYHLTRIYQAPEPYRQAQFAHPFTPVARRAATFDPLSLAAGGVS